ncbi:MAG TPA: AbrB/MazE/SpoVT family DNA-binding domain-containing protein [Rhizomicrobium sp.]|nr:AbrB/MazE/SpoVT family DNA-binding domain-containing protein [Rhizomicrobium sp.]
MRVSSKGQVTIPADVLEKAGISPDSEVEFVYEGHGRLVLVPTEAPKEKTRGEQAIAHMQAFGRAHPINMTTDEIMALTRGED